ncbi:HEAT repeat-containing protein [Emericellopsis atlantica]|uniref:HEAT repeat-containing protein n=1 Tax=Emericellopsis atlantica TaxID=2614577 RepID=A0A9P8CTI7_9HYPO|nr:HEAT repeat-containing protein [Emericellopsis atlantica]KAG9259214.1 HEAT repeat-containing protein [Emericellopsis atlantica]
MADGKLTDQQVIDLTTILRSDQSLDAKVNYLNLIKSGIKQHNVPETSVAQLFDGLRAASSSQHTSIVNVGFTSLNHLITRLTRQEPKYLAKEAARTLPLIAEKLGDQKDKLRTTAHGALSTYYTVAPIEVERVIRNNAMTGKNPRAKEAAMAWLLQMHQEQGLQFRTYVPLLMDLLEDADGMVRDAAKSTVIELFRNAPGAAKSDLKRQLKNFKVRPAIEQSIVKAIAPNSASVSASARPETPAEAAAPAPAPKRQALSASTTSTSVDRPITPALEVRASENIEPQYVNTHRELDDIFKGMAWCFEGKESEQNWVQREASMGTLRKLNAGNAPADFPETFLTGLKSVLDGIIKSMTSLRTSLSKEACALVQDVAITFGPGIDPLVELLMQTLVKLSAGTKKLSSQLANTTIETMLHRVTYNHRLMQHIHGAAQDKNVQPRTYATGWLKIILKKEAGHKSHLEHSGGLDLIEKSIKRGLADANPAVRERMRSTFWTFWGIFPARADALKEDLDATAQKLLNKDPSNPNAPTKAEAPVAARPGLGLSKSTMTKPSVREHMLAQKRAALDTKKLPARPGSAMAHISPVRKVSDPKPTNAAKPTGTRARPEAGTISVNASGMSVAPMRPARRRPEMAARPATAGPYSVREHPTAMEADSPGATRNKAPLSRPQLKDTPPRRTAQRPRPGHASHASESHVRSPSARPKSALSTRGSPAKIKSTQSAAPAAPAVSSSVHGEDEVPETIPAVVSVVEPPVAEPVTTSEDIPDPQPEQLQSPGEAPPVEPEAEAEVEAEVKVEESLPAVVAPEEDPEPTRSPTPAVAPPEFTLPIHPAPSEHESLKVYEDPFVEEQPTSKPTIVTPVLEDRPVNEGAALQPSANILDGTNDSPEKARQNSRLLDSGIAKIRAKSLEVHGFRKLQSLVRDSKTVLNDEKFEVLLLGLFEYLEDPLSSVAADKVQDVKAQILTTIKLLLKKDRENFKPHVSKCLESLLKTRSAYDNRSHIVSGLELLSDTLVSLGDPAEIICVLASRLNKCSDSSVEDCRALSMGLHILKTLLEKQPQAESILGDSEMSSLGSLAGRCLESSDSGVRMDAVQLCVALHSNVGEGTFWGVMKGVKDDPKSLITYYIVKKQREQAA